MTSELSTATQRRPAIDLARVTALAMVVLGHLSLAVIDRGPDGALRGANVLALYPRYVWLTMLAPMPLFFAAAGWANSTASLRTAVPRLRAIVGLGAIVVTSWTLAAIIELLIRHKGAIVADGARIATQPLWFLAVYVPFASQGSRLAKLAKRPVIAFGSCLGVLLLLDFSRFALGAPNWVGCPGFAVAWCVPWLMGAWWRCQRESGEFDERKVGAMVAVVSLIVAFALVRYASYHPALIDAVKGQRSNTTPPTLFTAVAAMLQVGTLMMMASLLDKAGTRLRSLLTRAGEAAVGVYVWHLTALALCAGILATGLGTPRRFSSGWWISRPFWFAAILGITAFLVSVTSLARDHLVGRRRGEARDAVPHPLLKPSQMYIGLALSTAGAAIVGLLGPRTLPAAILGVTCFVGGWGCLRERMQD